MVDLRTYSELHSVRTVGSLVRRWWKLEIAFADASGYVLDHADGKVFPSGNEFCRKALGSKEGFRRCNDSVKRVSSKLKSSKSRAVVIRQCHLGFDVVAAPIVFADSLVGFVFAGGALHSKLKASQKIELFSKSREFSRGDRDELEGALNQIPSMSEVELTHLASMLEYAASEIMKVQAQRSEVQTAATNASRINSNSGGAAVQMSFGDIVGASQSMIEMFALLKKVVKSEATVLVHGESGTGKELIARAIHFYGPRAKKNFVVQNCSAFNDNLLESALFGHVRGAFTGAVKDQKGLFEMASGGTFFLDEIGDMSPALQVKLLRVLQEGTLTPVGATKPVKVDVRIVAASHKNLTALVASGQFREDLYYRVNVLSISVPPLRERIEDLPMLVSHFLKKHHHGEGSPPTLAGETLAALANYRWPGNIRELENEMERINVLACSNDIVCPSMLSPRISEALKGGSTRETGADKETPNGLEARRSGAGPRLGAEQRDWASKGGKGATLRELVEGMEAAVIGQGLIRTHWNKSQLAKELGMSRSNLIQKCAYYRLERKN